MPRPRVELSGKTFGKWKVLGLSTKITGTRSRHWSCVCVCGARRDVRGCSLTSGGSLSCGCAVDRSYLFTHGLSKTKLYKVWFSMLARCRNKNSQFYASYGGRGIKVCKRWWKFENFLADMGEPKPGLSLDRIDNDGNYKPGNCRWTTQVFQIRNRRTSKFYEMHGERFTLGEWAEVAELNYGIVRNRLRLGWSLERALLVPNNGRGGNRRSKKEIVCQKLRRL